MNTHTEKTQENKNRSRAQNDTSKHSNETSFQFADNRPEATTQRKLNEMSNNSPEAKQAAQLKAIADNRSGTSVQLKGIDEEELLQGKFTTAQRKKTEVGKNNTGMPDHLKTGMENLSGMSLDDVNVHYNSARPAGLQAHAYAQGTDIHVAPGQEKHLPHEAWHVVQQKQGRVKPTMQMKGKVNVNDDKGLEKEADVMGEKALQMKSEESNILKSTTSFTPEIQLVLIDPNNSGLNASLTKQYHDEEDNGDACSASSKSIQIHQQAIDHYKRAKALRKRAGKLHQDDDGGHLLAIDTLNDKIQRRKELIAGLSPKAVASSPKIKADVKKGPSNWFGHEPMGTGGQASWLPGNQSAWEPRKTGT